jgi:AsmA protein
LRAELPWNDLRLTVTAFVRSPERLASEGSPVDLTVTGPLLNASFSGLATLKEGLELAGKAEAWTMSLSDLAALAGMPLGSRAFEEVSLAGSLDLAGRRLSLKEARLKLDQTNAQGALTIDLAGPRPRITAKLGVDRIDFARYAAPPTSKQSAWAEGWSGAPLDLGPLKRLDGEFLIAASELVAGKVVIGRSQLDATLDDGVLVAGVAPGAAFYGGTAEARIVLDGSGKLPVMRGSLTATGIDGGKFIADVAGLGGIAGKADLHLDLSASGASQLELISLLRGRARLRFSDGAVNSIDISAMLAGLRQDVLEGWGTAADRKTDFSLLEASFTVEDGIAETTDLRLIGPVARVTAEGSVDLLRQRVDLKARPFVTLAEEDGGNRLLTLPVPVVIEGFWSAPKIYPDIAGILDDPEAGYAALGKLMKGGKAVGLDAAGKLDKAARDHKLEPAKGSPEPQSQ